MNEIVFVSADAEAVTTRTFSKLVKGSSGAVAQEQVQALGSGCALSCVLATMQRSQEDLTAPGEEDDSFGEGKVIFY